MLSEDNTPKFIDFGLSKQVEDFHTTNCTTAKAGTWKWMPPEKKHWEQSTKASDVYSFGLVAAYIFTGREPNEHEEAIATFGDELKDVLGFENDVFFQMITSSIKLIRY